MSRERNIPLVHLVGAGPGDPELLTLKAIRAIRQATVLLVDDLVGRGALRYARRSTRVVDVGKRGGCASTPQAFIERLMASEAMRGERVVRLKGGDPFVFGRGGEEVAHLRALGVEVEVVNGITAGLAAATSIGVPLTHRDHAHGVLFVTGHARSDGRGAAIDWPSIAAAATSAASSSRRHIASRCPGRLAFWTIATGVDPARPLAKPACSASATISRSMNACGVLAQPPRLPTWTMRAERLA